MARMSQRMVLKSRSKCRNSFLLSQLHNLSEVKRIRRCNEPPSVLSDQWLEVVFSFLLYLLQDLPGEGDSKGMKGTELRDNFFQWSWNIFFFVHTLSNYKFRELATVCLPCQHWTKSLSIVWWHISVSQLCCCWSMAVSLWVASITVCVCFGVPPREPHYVKVGRVAQSV